MIQKGTQVSIKPLETISEYLHHLDGIIKKTRKRPIMRRTEKSGWNPVNVGTTTEFMVDLSHHSSIDLDNGNKKFWFESKFLTEV